MIYNPGQVIGKRNCPDCGAEFDVTKSTIQKIYCNDKCKGHLNRERIKDLAKKNWRRKHPK